MKKFFIGLLKALGYFGIYLGAQILVTFVYVIVISIPVAVKYSLGNYDLMDPMVMGLYLDEVLQGLMEAVMPITILSGLLTIGIVWLIFVCRKKKITKELSLRKISVGTAVSVIVMGFGFNLLTGVLFSVLPESWIASYEEAANATFVGEFWIVALTTGIMAPLVEEFVFRGLIYTRLRKGMPMVAAAVITAVWFGVMHGHPLWIAYAAVLGLVMVWIFERTGSLFASMLFHFGYNSVAVIEMALPETMPDWAGIVMVAAGVILSAVGVYCFLKIPKAEVVGETVVQEAAETVIVTDNFIDEAAEEPTENLK